MNEASFVTMRQLEQAARAQIAARLNDVRPGEALYFPPRILIEMGGEEYHVPSGWILKEMGFKMVDVNIWREE
jgi:hypothetical protein